MGHLNWNSYLQIGMMTALPFAGAVLLAWSAVSLYLDLKGRQRRKMLERFGDQGAQKIAKAVEASILRQARFTQSQGFEQLLYKISFTPKIQRMLEQARIPWSATRFLINLTGISVLAATLCLLIGWRVSIALVVGLSIFAVPMVIIDGKRRARMKKLVEQLPEVFELISQSLRAGHSLGSGLQLVGTQLPDPAGTIFSRVFLEQNFGVKIEDALKALADRVDQLDIRLFVTAILVQKQSGGNLTEVLDKISGVIRDRIKVLGQAKALTAEGRMSGTILCILPVIVFLVVWGLNPGYLDVLLFERTGQFMLGGALVLQLIGMLIIRKIVNIKV